MKHKIKYLPLPIGNLPTAWVICISEAEFIGVQEANIEDHGLRDSYQLGHDNGVNACVHDYDRLLIVCLSPDTKPDEMVHEAVHVWQLMMRHIGEDKPGIEVEAYGIQFIFKTMQREIERRKKCHSAKRT